MAQEDIVIVSAVRTAVGSFLGSLAKTPAHALGATVISEALKRANLPAKDVSEVIMGQVLSAAQGQNPARQASMAAGCPCEVPAWGVNQVCGSGLRSVALAAQAIALGDSSIVVAGGQENMSLSPHAAPLRQGIKMGPGQLVDTMVNDGLMDAFNHYHMGITAENIADKWNLSRDEQDDFAVASQNKAEAAQKEGRFDNEIVEVELKTRKGTSLFNKDEYIRLGARRDDLSALRPAFRKDGTVTAGNASGLNDGAAALVLMSRAQAERRGLTILARVAAWAHAGVDPEIMGSGPVPASRKALEKAGWSINDLDLVEANEAFAAQALCVNRELGLDPEKVNVNGGAIAIGHPIGASGARILVTLIHEMTRRRAKKGLATLCIGGGMGVALCVEGPS